MAADWEDELLDPDAEVALPVEGVLLFLLLLMLE